MRVLGLLLTACGPTGPGPNEALDVPVGAAQGAATEEERAAAERIADGSPLVLLTDRTTLWATVDGAGRPGFHLDEQQRYLVRDDRARELLTPVAHYDDEVHLAAFDVETIWPNGRVVPVDSREVWDVRQFPANVLYTDARTRIALPRGLVPGAVVSVRTVRTQSHARYVPHVPLFEDVPTVSREVLVAAQPGAGISVVRLPEGTPLAPDPDGVFRVLLRDVPAARFEADAPPSLRHRPVLSVAVRHAPAGAGEAYFASFDDLARYYESLVRPSLEPDERIRALARSIAAEAGADPLARIAAAARWVRTHLRYVAIEAGIHAVQPRPAPDVLRHGHGDCKELSALLVSLLRLLDVDAHPLLVPSSGVAVLPRGIPGLQWFNHVVVAIRFEGGYRFIDPTLPAGDTWTLDPSVQGVEGLVASQTPAIVRLPTDELPQNRSRTDMRVAIAADGSATMEVDETLEGLPAMLLRERVRFGRPGEGQAAIRATFHSRYGSGEPEIVEERGFDRNDGPTVLRWKIRAPRWVLAAGGRWLVYPEILGTSVQESGGGDEERTLPIDLGAPTVSEIEAVLTLPPGARVEAIPDPVRVDTAFGSAEVRFETTGTEIRYRRRVETRVRLLAASEIEALARFQDAIGSAASAPVVVAAPEVAP